MTHYYSLNEYCRDTFGHKLYKLALDAGMTCPNRDGTLSVGGCSFCSLYGGGEFAEKQSGDILEQIKNAKKRVEHKNKGGKYIAYFQSFTNTYAEISYLEKIFTQAMAHPEVEVLSVATRPDCLGEDVLSLLKELNKSKPVWVELGLQTSNEKTAESVNRCYKNEVFAEAVKNLNGIGIKTVAHVIIGLPGETYGDCENTVKYALDCGAWGLKLQLLHILKGSRLEKDYIDGKIKCLSREEYIDCVCRLLEIIKPETVIHRLTGDGDKKLLLAPLWSTDKKAVLNALNKALDERNIIQGGKYTAR